MNVHFPLVFATLAVSFVQAVELPLIADFTPGQGYQPGPVNGQQGWKTEQGDAMVFETYGLSYFSIPAQAPNEQASVYFQHPIAGKPVFIDLSVWLGAGGGSAEFVDANGSLTSFPPAPNSEKQSWPVCSPPRPLNPPAPLPSRLAAPPGCGRQLPPPGRRSKIPAPSRRSNSAPWQHWQSQAPRKMPLC